MAHADLSELQAGQSAAYNVKGNPVAASMVRARFAAAGGSTPDLNTFSSVKVFLVCCRFSMIESFA